MATIDVSSATELMAAAARAQAGDIIALAPGSYDKLWLRDIRFADEVTITSADHDRPAQLTGLKAFGVENITFRNIVLADSDATTPYDFEVKYAANVRFDGVTISGQQGDAGYASNSFMVRESRDVSITNSEITHLRYGINMLDNTGVTIRGNLFHDLRADGFHGGGLSDVLIADNVFTDFRPAPSDHPDAIQFWTANQTDSAENITITGNVIHRGEGAPIQGIFMGDETDALPYRNVTISDNLVLGGLFNGIHVERAAGLSLTRNIVAGYTDQASWIRVAGSDTLTRNVAQVYILDGKTVAAPPSNAGTPPIFDQGGGFVADWLAAHPGWAAMAHASPVLGDAVQHLDALSSQPPVPIPVTTISGTDGADRLFAAPFGDSVVFGGEGNDQLTGGIGHTRLEGGSGNDIYFVNSDRDLVVEQGSGADTVYTSVDYHLPDGIETLRLAAGGLTVHGNALDNRILGSAGADEISGGGGRDSIQGLAGDDILRGESGKNNLHGGSGDDLLYAGDDGDTLNGGDDADRLWGGPEKDMLEGGAGNDVLVGGRGGDLFVFRDESIGDHDVIGDFSLADGDRIGLSLIDADVGTAVNDAFRFIGSQPFSGTAGEVRYAADAAGLVCTADVNGDAFADFTITLPGIQQLSSAAFIL